MPTNISHDMLERIATHLINELRVIIAREKSDMAKLDRLVRMIYVQSLFKMFEILKGPADNKKIARQLTALIVQKLTGRSLSDEMILAFIGPEEAKTPEKTAKTAKPTPKSNHNARARR